MNLAASISGMWLMISTSTSALRDVLVSLNLIVKEAAGLSAVVAQWSDDCVVYLGNSRFNSPCSPELPLTVDMVGTSRSLRHGLEIQSVNAPYSKR